MLAKRLLALGATLLVVLVAMLLSVRGQDAVTDLAGGLVGGSCAQSCAPFEIVWVGDIMLGDRAQRQIDQHGYEWPFEQVRPLLANAFVIGNAEAPITTRAEPYFREQKFSYNVQPAAAVALANVGFEAIGLSNNHALDRGPEGLRDTIRHGQEAGLRTFGAGMSDTEASAPLLIDTGYGTVAVLVFGRDWNYAAVAAPDRAATTPNTPEAIGRIKEAAMAAGARWVVAYVHWGENYEEVNGDQRRAAEAFARAGYDLVVGAHPHLAQEIDIVRGMPVLYSLGNFTFGSPGGYSRKAPGYSLTARTGFGPDGLMSIELTCIATDNEVVKFQPRPCTAAQSQTLLKRLGSSVTIKGEKSVVTWDRRQG
jgi:poly-gamma-glutamate synthesis protein (capsule biosynthesis protein)